MVSITTTVYFDIVAAFIVFRSFCFGFGHKSRPMTPWICMHRSLFWWTWKGQVLEKHDGKLPDPVTFFSENLVKVYVSATGSASEGCWQISPLNNQVPKNRHQHRYISVTDNNENLPVLGWQYKVCQWPGTYNHNKTLKGNTVVDKVLRLKRTL